MSRDQLCGRYRCAAWHARNQVNRYHFDPLPAPVHTHTMRPSTHARAQTHARTHTRAHTLTTAVMQCLSTRRRINRVATCSTCARLHVEPHHPHTHARTHTRTLAHTHATRLRKCTHAGTHTHAHLSTAAVMLRQCTRRHVHSQGQRTSAFVLRCCCRTCARSQVEHDHKLSRSTHARNQIGHQCANTHTHTHTHLDNICLLRRTTKTFLTHNIMQACQKLNQLRDAESGRVSFTQSSRVSIIKLRKNSLLTLPTSNYPEIRRLLHPSQLAG